MRGTTTSTRCSGCAAGPARRSCSAARRPTGGARRSCRPPLACRPRASLPPRTTTSTTATP
eukprot:7771951-Pyramimonas_sp.AAC.1